MLQFIQKNAEKVEKWRKEQMDKKKTKIKIVALNSTILMITLNVNILKDKTIVEIVRLY